MTENNMIQDQDTINFLYEIKEQETKYHGRQTLHKILKNDDGSSPSNLKLQWLRSEGMGSVDLYDLSDSYYQIASKLLYKGELVPTSTTDWDNKPIQLISHFDNVNWGKTEDGNLIIYTLINNPNPEQEDEIIALNETHYASLDLLKKTTTVEDAPITLQNGSKITPILTNQGVIEYRKRQGGMPTTTVQKKEFNFFPWSPNN